MAKTKKTTSSAPVKLPEVSKSVFKSTAKVLPRESDEIKISAAISKAEREKKELELLSHELKKPASSRNQALMRKYQTQATSGSIDNYPDTSTGRFKIFVQIPEDPSVPLEHRPEPWAITVALKNRGSEFQFAFPISRAGNVNPNVTYKLDNFPNVYTDVHGDVDVNVSDYSLYEAMLDYKNKNMAEMDLVRDTLRDYGVLKDDDGKVDFRVYNRGFLVTYTKLKAPEKAVPAVPAAQGFNMGKVEFLEDLEIVGDRQTVNKIIKDLQNQRGFKLVGLEDGEYLDDGAVAIKAIITKRDFTPGSYHIILEDLEDGILGAVVINGPWHAKKRFKTSGREIDLVKAAEKLNRKFYDEYKAMVE